MDESDIRQFFDSLEDTSGFEFETSAVMEDEPGEDGPDGFIAVIQGGLSLWEDHWHDQGGSLTFAVLETDHRHRLFVGREDESTDAFARRLRVEARVLADPWLFVVGAGRAAIGQSFDMSRASERVRANRSGLLHDAALWYAEARGRGVADQRFGAIALDDPPQVFQSDNQTGVRPIFTSILRGHPARRRYRMRRAQ